MQLKCLLKQSGQANEWPILTEYGHETPLSKLVAANEQDLAHFSTDGTPNKSLISLYKSYVLFQLSF